LKKKTTPKRKTMLKRKTSSTSVKSKTRKKTLAAKPKARKTASKTKKAAGTKKIRKRVTTAKPKARKTISKTKKAAGTKKIRKRVTTAKPKARTVNKKKTSTKKKTVTPKKLKTGGKLSSTKTKTRKTNTKPKSKPAKGKTEVAVPKLKKYKKNRKTRYNLKELEHFKVILLNERKTILESAKANMKSLVDSESGDYVGDNLTYSTHMAEQGTDEMEREKNYMFVQRDEKYLGYLQDALTRVEHGIYGICRECIEEPKNLCKTCPLIPKERLELVPITQHCIECKNLIG